MQSYLQYKAFVNDMESYYGRQSFSMHPPRNSMPINALAGSSGEPTLILKNDTHGIQEMARAIVVKFEGPNDLNDPRNWPRWKRVFCTANVGIIALVICAAGAIDSPAIPQAATEFKVSHVVEALATGLFLCGIGAGALIAGPLSETVGRNPVYFASLTLFMFLILGAGLSQSIEAQLVCRFFAGFCGESPLSTIGGSISDLWDPLDRLIAFPIFAAVGSTGPLIGPVLGGFIAESSFVSWRWTEWTTLLASGVLLLSLILFQPETYEPILLKWKAKQVRAITGDARYRAPIERDDHNDFWKRMQISLVRPFVMIFHEPVILLWTIYLSVVYVILFGFLASFTYIFQDNYGLSQGITGLLFLGIEIGTLLASVILTPFVYQKAKKYLATLKTAALETTATNRLQPEFFLWYSMLGAPAIPISLFWMGWTATPNISMWSPIAASVLFGWGNLSIFVSTCLYMIDTYETYAASALTINTFVRYTASGAMIQASISMYENMGVNWALTLLGSIAVVLAAVPYIFYRYGPWIRSNSIFASGL